MNIFESRKNEPPACGARAVAAHCTSILSEKILDLKKDDVRRRKPNASSGHKVKKNPRLPRIIKKKIQPAAHQKKKMPAAHSYI